jgi:hypothetical protein
MSVLKDLADKATHAAKDALDKAKEVATEVVHQAEHAVDATKEAVHKATEAKPK